MKKHIVTLGCLLVLAGCGPTRKIGEESRTGRVPFALKVAPDHRRAVVQWRVRGDASFMGYNIYIVPANSVSAAAKPFNKEPFPGDTTPDDGIETFDANGLDNGVEYKVWVRALYGDQSQSPSTDTLTVVCGGHGILSLGVRYNSDYDGFSFAENKTVRANAADNDLYFLSLQGVMYLASPTRLDGFLRATTFTVLPYKGEFETVRENVIKDRPKASEERVMVKNGDWVLLRVADGSHTLLQILDSAGSSDEDTIIRLFYAYSPLKDRLFF